MFRREFRELATRPMQPDIDEAENGRGVDLLPVPAWLTATHMAFMAWTVVTSHYPALFVGGFLIFIGFARATAAYQSRIELKAPLLVGFFLAGLYVNVSIGGTLTHFAAPPVLMVARHWNWTTWFMLGHFGWRAVIAIVGSTLAYFLLFRREFSQLAERPMLPDVDEPENMRSGAELLPVPAWLTVVHVAFMAWTVLTSHYPALFLGGFLIFLGFARATAAYQSRIDLKAPLLVGFFLAGRSSMAGCRHGGSRPCSRACRKRRSFSARRC